jgi:2'-5' RNA ligase
VKRIFIGLPVDDQLSQILSTISEPQTDVRWIPGRNLHLTLEFLGPTSDNQIGVLSNRLQEIDQSPIALDVTGLTCLPNLRRPRVIALAMRSTESLASLHTAIRNAVQEAGLSLKPSRLSPHITVARLKSPANSWLREYLGSHDQHIFSSVRYASERFCLYESTLTLHGACYAVLGSFPLTDR